MSPVKSLLLWILYSMMFQLQSAKQTLKPYKKHRKYIDCDVCRIGMAWFYKLNNDLRLQKKSVLDYGEYEVHNLMEKLCNMESQTGKWIRTFHVAYNETANDIQLLFDKKVSKSNRWHKTIELSCKHIVDRKEDDIIAFIFNKHNENIDEGFRDDFIQHICTHACDLYISYKTNGKIQKAIQQFEDIEIIQHDDASEELKAFTDNVHNMAKQFGYQFADKKHKKEL